MNVVVTHKIPLLWSYKTDACLVLPDVEFGYLELVLTLAYTGAVTSITRHQVTAISDIFNLLSVKLEKFMLRADKKPEIQADYVVETEDINDYCDDENIAVPVHDNNKNWPEKIDNSESFSTKETEKKCEKCEAKRQDESKVRVHNEVVHKKARVWRWVGV